VTLVSLSLILSLTLYEWLDYRRVHMVCFSLLSQFSNLGLILRERRIGTFDCG